jgi:ketosteroid isomerase-like protein
MRCAADETVTGIIENWSAAFNRLDADALAGLYSSNAFFFGSKSQLYRGNEGVAAYFSALPRWNSPIVQFTDRATAQVIPI